MLIIHGSTGNSSEYQAAKQLGQLACDFDLDIADSKLVVLEIFPSVQCFGQKTQDIDLLVFYADYRAPDKAFISNSGKRLHSFCATIEVKGHSPENVFFEGQNCYVTYNGERHNVTSQSEKQKYSVKNYIEKHLSSQKAPWIINLIWFSRLNSVSLPKGDSNILGMDTSWRNFLEAAALRAGSGADNVVKTFTSRVWMDEVKLIFSKKLEPSKIDRKRLEAITKNVLDRTKQQYAEMLGQQLLIFRGRGGTGKTVRLIQIAYQAYDELGLRVLLLTYNKALVADLRRLFGLLGVKDAIGESGIAIKTIHSFMHTWLFALGVIKANQSDFYQKYEEYKNEALSLLRGNALTPIDISKAKADASRDLSWDLILIDESQDWPATERDLIYQLYEHRKVVITDGVDQFVRGVARVDWREGISKSESQIVSLTKSLRLKASLCHTVCHFAEQIELINWKLEPVPESQGGKVIVVVGNALSEDFHRRLIATARAGENKPIDMLFCVPPSWVNKINGSSESTVAKVYKNWGLEVWDGVDLVEREDYPTSLDQFRIVQYDSCRGLEGWLVVCFALDEFFEYKRSNAAFADSTKADMFFEADQAAMDYAKRWLMIPLTRAIDTLIIHVNSEDSYIGGILIELHRKYPQEVEWIEYS